MLFQNIVSQTVTLDIHLSGCDTVACTCNLEVHVTQVVFVSQISDNTAYLSSPAFLINPIAIPETGFLIGTPASIKANVPAQTVAIEEEPLDSRISETTRTQ